MATDGQKSDADSISMNASTELREDLIETAVKFLQNTKVRNSPFVQRKTFLSRKGLTEYEIEEAVRRSGTAGDAMVTPSTPESTVVHMPSSPMPVAPVSTWIRVKELMNIAVFIGGALYALYQFYKKVLVHWFFGKPPLKREVEQTALDELQRSVKEVSSSVVELREIVSRSSEQMNTLVKSSATERGGTEMGRMNLSEIKDEVKSLKSLLLNKNQFPQVPVTAPVIPAWQLQMASKSSKPSILSDVTSEPAVQQTVTDHATTSQTTAPETSHEAGYQAAEGKSPFGDPETRCSSSDISLRHGVVSETKDCGGLGSDHKELGPGHEGPAADDSPNDHNAILQ